eukprot:434433-Hanusia_phi.AAC.5
MSAAQEEVEKTFDDNTGESGKEAEADGKWRAEALAGRCDLIGGGRTRRALVGARALTKHALRSSEGYSSPSPPPTACQSLALVLVLPAPPLSYLLACSLCCSSRTFAARWWGDIRGNDKSKNRQAEQ